MTAQYPGGWSETLSLLVGPDEQPGTLLSEMSSVTNSSVGALVQPGERWT